MEITLQYLAGFFDGEGCVGINNCRADNRRRVEIQVDNTAREVLDEFSRRFGGAVYLLNRSIEHPNWKDIYAWKIADRNAEHFLKVMTPFLILKRAKAELALKYRGTHKRNNVANIAQMPAIAKEEARKRNAEIKKLREEIYNEFKTLV